MSLQPAMMTVLKTTAENSAIDGYVFANPKSPAIRTLVKEGMVEINETEKDPSNPDKVMTRLTKLGHETAGTGVTFENGPALADPMPAPDPATGLTPTGDASVIQVAARKRGGRPAGQEKPQITRAAVRMALPVATVGKRGGNREEMYPFSTLGAPDHTGHDSFFVATTPSVPKPYRTLISAVASANKRWKAKGVEFAVRDMGIDPEMKVAGARCFRVK